MSLHASMLAEKKPGFVGSLVPWVIRIGGSPSDKNSSTSFGISPISNSRFHTKPTSDNSKIQSGSFGANHSGQKPIFHFGVFSQDAQSCTGGRFNFPLCWLIMLASTLYASPYIAARITKYGAV